MKLNARDVQLLRDFLSAMESVQAQCFLVGAAARMLGFDQRWSLQGARATLDWDFAVRAESWDRWEELVELLTRGPRSRFARGHSPQRFVHAAGSVLDLVPYGGLESPQGQIAWPDHTHMNVLGFSAAEKSCDRVVLEKALVVPVAAVPSLALMKLHAYGERRLRAERKDIQDFDWFLSNYEAAGNELRVHDELGEALLSDRLDIDAAGAALLGLDVARLHAADVLLPVMPILVEARDPWSTVIADVLLAASATDDERMELRRRRAAARFRAFELGIGLAPGTIAR